MTGDLALSCYTTSLVCYLERIRPGAADAFSSAVRLAVRTDLPEQIAFSHHRRIDRWAGRQLGYDSASSWEAAQEKIAAEASRSGCVIAVASTAAMPWSPGGASHAAPHWILISPGSSGGWRVADPFAALLPHGEQRPFQGCLTDAVLRSVLEPGPFPGRQVRLRDCYALGERIATPPVGRYRWLRGEAAEPEARPASPRSGPGPGTWQLTTAGSLRWLAGRLGDDPLALRACLDDLWAAARHHTFRLRADGGPDTQRLAAAWADLPRGLRFAADSAARGRPRPGLVRTSLSYLADLTECLPAMPHVTVPLHSPRNSHA